MRMASTRKRIAAFLLEAGYDPLLVEKSMDALVDAILTKKRHERLDAWLDSLQDIPLTPEEVDAIMASLEAQRRA